MVIYFKFGSTPIALPDTAILVHFSVAMLRVAFWAVLEVEYKSAIEIYGMMRENAITTTTTSKRTNHNRYLYTMS